MASGSHHTPESMQLQEDSNAVCYLKGPLPMPANRACLLDRLVQADMVAIHETIGVRHSVPSAAAGQSRIPNQDHKDRRKATHQKSGYA